MKTYSKASTDLEGHIERMQAKPRKGNGRPRKGNGQRPAVN